MINASKSKAEEKFAEEFAKLMIQKIEMLTQDWTQPWFNTKGVGYPQSITGRMYNGMNSFMLYLLTEMKQFKTPVFMTFNQAQKLNVSILKGQKCFPVIYWDFTIRHKETREKITLQEYQKLTTSEKDNYIFRPFLVYHNVFNIDQTNLQEVNPELYKQFEDKFKVQEVKDANGLYSHPAIDDMLNQNGWLCKVNVQESNNAFYRPSTDEIVVPLKGQFDSGEAFYATLLHEMTHSTGTEARLNRKHGKTFGDDDYAQEELVAELTSAMVCQSIGITTSIREENAAYLKGWLGKIKQSPDFLMTILEDVNKANRMIINEVAKFDMKMSEELKNQEAINKKEEENRTEANDTKVRQAIPRKKYMHI